MKVAVIGGGIQGTCVAMELATRGVDVDLFERGAALMDGASRHNEGKIHLGFVYANDPSLRTAELMFRGARSFAPLMSRWLGTSFDEVAVSTPFNYAVHKESLLSADRLHSAYQRIGALMRSSLGDGSYFGVDDPHIVTRLGRDDHAYGPAVDAVFATREVAINPAPVADLIVKKMIDADDIHLAETTTVIGVNASRRLLEVEAEDGSELARGPYDHVVNCAWSGRPAIDATVGFHVESPWTYRMKYFVVVSAPTNTASVPSTTVVLGGFGDIVDYGDGEYFLSWYPVGRLGWSADLVPPDWPTHPNRDKAMEIATSTLTQLQSIVPEIESFEAAISDGLDVRGGVIYSLGNTDVDDRNSQFHERSAVGLRSMGRYHSIDTGKYTTAPLFAVETADRITAIP